MATNTNTWDRQQISSLTDWYGASDVDPSAPASPQEVLDIDPDSPKGQTLTTLQALMCSELEPPTAATTLASIALTHETPTRHWTWTTNAICLASEHCADAVLDRLADLMAELAKLPYSLPADPSSDLNNPTDLHFSCLPAFGHALYAHLQGPRQHFCKLQTVSLEARNAASLRSRSSNAFAALLLRRHHMGLLPRNVDFSWLARVVLSRALNHQIPTWQWTDQRPWPYIGMGEPASLWLPAAAAWGVIAGKEVLEALLRDEEGLLRHPFSWRRWELWRGRLGELAGQEGVIGRELAGVCGEAERGMEVDLGEWWPGREGR